MVEGLGVVEIVATMATLSLFYSLKVGGVDRVARRNSRSTAQVVEGLAGRGQLWLLCLVESRSELMLSHVAIPRATHGRTRKSLRLIKQTFRSKKHRSTLDAAAA